MSSRHIVFPCPSCSRSLRIRRDYQGKRVTCRFCDHPFVVEFKELPAPVGEEDDDPNGRLLTTAEAEQLYQRVLALHRETEELGRQLACRTAERDAARQETEAARKQIEQEIERQRQETFRWRSEAEALGREKEQLAAHCEGLDQAAQRAEAAHAREIKKLEEALEQSRLEAEAASRRSSELLAQFQLLWDNQRQQTADSDHSQDANPQPHELESIPG